MARRDAFAVDGAGMAGMQRHRHTAPTWVRRAATAGVRFLCLLGLCAAYLQGGFNKLVDFPAALAEMQHFGLSPAAPMAAGVIVLEFGAALLILSGWYRWLGAMALAGFTLVASVIAVPFWNVLPPERFMVENAFFEHLGLVGGLLLVAWHDLQTHDDH